MTKIHATEFINDASVSWKPIKSKPVQVSFKVLTENCTITTLEGDVSAQIGDYVLTGTAGEIWPITPEKFTTGYEVTAPAKATKRSAANRTATPLDRDMQVRNPVSGALFYGKEGDLVIRDVDGGMWVVDADVFSRTYEFIQEGK